MTVAEAAREIGLSPDAVYDLCKRGQLGHRRIGPRRGRIDILPAHVAAYLASCEVPAGETRPARAVPRPPVRRKPSHLRSDGKPFRFLK
jgi:excisionase family DNA binding protein